MARIEPIFGPVADRDAAVDHQRRLSPAPIADARAADGQAQARAGIPGGGMTPRSRHIARFVLRAIGAVMLTAAAGFGAAVFLGDADAIGFAIPSVALGFFGYLVFTADPVDIKPGKTNEDVLLRAARNHQEIVIDGDPYLPGTSAYAAAQMQID